MDFVRLLQSLEEAIYEIVTWIVFVPKTFIKVIFRPNWIQDYVSEEFEKESDKRFQAYISPIIFWLIVAVLPYTLTSVEANINGSTLTIGDLNTSVLYLSTLSLMAIPAFTALFVLWFKKLPVEREPLKRLLYIQCYPAAIFELFALPSMALFALPQGSVSSEISTLIQIVVLISGGWYLLAQVFIFKQELAIPWQEAMWRAGLASFLSLVLLVVILVLLTLYFIAIDVVKPLTP